MIYSFILVLRNFVGDWFRVVCRVPRRFAEGLLLLGNSARCVRHCGGRWEALPTTLAVEGDACAWHARTHWLSVRE